MLPFRGGTVLKDYNNPAVYGRDTIAPSVVLSTDATSPVFAAFTVTATFSEDVTGFVVGDITVTNGSAGTFVAVSGSVYTFVVTPNWTGDVSVQIGAGVCSDGVNLNIASNTLSYNTWRMYASFSADLAAPLASPYVANVGTLVLTQNDGQFSVSGGALQFPAQATPAWGDLGYSGRNAAGAGFARAVGLAYIIQPTTTNLRWTMAWSTVNTPHTPVSANSDIAALGNTNTLTFFYPAGSSVELNAGSADAPVVAILRAAGSWIIGQISGVPCLLYIDSVRTTATVYPMFSTFDGSGYLDSVGVAQLGAPWNSEYGIATNRIVSPAANATTTSEANSHVELTWTPAAGETLEISFRRTDDDNRLIVRCAQAGSTIKLIKVQTGAESELNSAAQTWTIGTPYRVHLWAYGNVIRTFAGNANKNYAENTFNQTETGIKVAGFTTATNLVCWPHTISGAALTELQRYGVFF